MLFSVIPSSPALWLHQLYDVQDLMRQMFFFLKYAAPATSCIIYIASKAYTTDLRSRGHGFQLTDYCSLLHKKYFYYSLRIWIYATVLIFCFLLCCFQPQCCILCSLVVHFMAFIPHAVGLNCYLLFIGFCRYVSLEKVTDMKCQ